MMRRRHEERTRDVLFRSLCMALLMIPRLLVAHEVEKPHDVAGHDCKQSDAERRLVELITRHPRQQREKLACDPQLELFAASRAQDMADRGYFGHVTPERRGPNALLRETGYSLPKYYVGGIANSLESIMAGEEDPGEVFEALLESSAHRDHLLGLADVYAKQQRYGVAYLHQPESEYAHYWVIVIAETGDTQQPMTCTPPPVVCIVH